ncbi:NAD(P)H-binding protein [Pelomonas sp. KK5]|uniref:NmrA family NAD(P)-binding protein n=1 Tax=Pelomonas sp. KK5 TaxID=1855730 RepID=UPI00097C7704|nr:NAD(P)H-binding protein [Pelomonas sp. KK5]
MNNSKTVLILGAAGRIGLCLTQAFAAAGWQVIAQARKPFAAPAGVQVLQCDARDVDTLVVAGQGAGVVIHALNPQYTEWERLALPLAEAAQQTAERLGALLMLPGNVYNFGRELPYLLKPDTPEVGSTSKARIRIEIERRMAAAAPRLDSVVLRAGDFFGGPGTGNWFDQAIVAKLRSHRTVTHPGRLDSIHAWAYLPDLARTFVAVADRRAELGGHHRFHFGGYWIEGQVLHEALEEACGHALKAASIPWWAMRLAAPFRADLRAYLEMNYLWQRPHRLDDTSLRALIGTVPLTPLVPALRTNLIELGQLDPAAAATHNITQPGSTICREESFSTQAR